MTKGLDPLEKARSKVQAFIASEFPSQELRGRFYRHPGESVYFYHVRVPADQTIRLLDAVEPLLIEIEEENEFSICLVPVPLSEHDHWT